MEISWVVSVYFTIRPACSIWNQIELLPYNYFTLFLFIHDASRNIGIQVSKFLIIKGKHPSFYTYVNIICYRNWYLLSVDVVIHNVLMFMPRIYHIINSA